MGRHHPTSGILCEIRFRPYNKSNDSGCEKSFLATLKRPRLKDAQKHCHDGTVVGVRKKQD
jgi:hypothetical protein